MTFRANCRVLERRLPVEDRPASRGLVYPKGMTEVHVNEGGRWVPATPQEPHGIMWDWIQGIAEEDRKLFTLPMVLAGATGVRYEGRRWEGKEFESPSLSSIEAALRALSCPVRFWFNPKKLQLVIEDETGRRVSIGTVQLSIPLVGPAWERWDLIARTLKQKREAS